MKNLFTLLLLLAFYVAPAQVQWTVFGGPQLTSARYSVIGKTQPNTYKPGLMLGGGMKVPFEEQLFFFPSVYYSLKGYKVRLNQSVYPPSPYARNNNTTLHTLEVAPLFQVDFSKRPEHFFVRVGPAVDFVFSGRERFDSVGTNGSTVSIDRPMIFSFGDYGRITASGNIHVGYETGRGLMIFAHYAQGVGSLNNHDGGPLILNRVVGVSVGWIFGQQGAAGSRRGD